MTQIPQDKSLDGTIDLMREGYLFLQNRHLKLSSDIFQTHLIGEKVICITGKESARIFYDPDRFIRKGAAPKRILKSLFGDKGVQTLDSSDHMARKEMFMSLMSKESIQNLVKITYDLWRRYTRKWEMVERINLFHETQELLCRAACEWAGVPVDETEIRERADDMVAMVNAFGAAGLRHWRGRQARSRVEEWVESIIADIRLKKIMPPDDSAACLFATAKSKDRLLDRHTAAVELINILRPITAISWYVAFSALAIHDYPGWKQRIRNDNDLEMFVHEVRRFYPFTPFVGARVRKSFNWRGYLFPEGRLALLDIYGALHDEKRWQDAHEFNPDRFRKKKEDFFDFIPQGGGDFLRNHRCAGEWITIELMKTSVNYLVNSIDFETPSQDLSYRLSRMPTYPNSGFIIARVKANKSERSHLSRSSFSL